MVLVTGTNRVVPGRLTFQALKANSPGSPVGRSARPSSRVSRASRKSWIIASPGSAVGAAPSGSRLAPAQAGDVEAGVVGEEQLGGVRVDRAGPRAPDPPVHPRQAVRRQVAEREPRDAGAQPHQHRLLELGEGHRLGLGGVRQGPARQRHPEAEAPRAPTQDGVGERQPQRLLRPGGRFIAAESTAAHPPSSSDDRQDVAGGVAEPRDGRSLAAPDALLVGLQLPGVLLEGHAGGDQAVHGPVDVVDREVEDRVDGRLVVGLGVDEHVPVAGDVQRQQVVLLRDPQARGCRRRTPSPPRCRGPRSLRTPWCR